MTRAVLGRLLLGLWAVLCCALMASAPPAPASRGAGDHSGDAQSLVQLASLLARAGLIDESRLALERAAAIDPSIASPALGPILPDEPIERGVGPDLITGFLNGIGNYTASGPVNGSLAFAIGSTACNVGTAGVDFQQNTNRHPVIAQHLYRLWTPPGTGASRIEQIGVSWVKHGGCASELPLCGACTQSPFGCSDVLSPNCADPYFASLNGLQSLLGPRTAINASTGAFVFPYPEPPAATTAIDRRLRVPASDMDTARFPGARYIGEAQYIAPDDSQAGNGFNNVTTRDLFYQWDASVGSVIFITFNNAERREPAIRAWATADPSVVLTDVTTTGEGVFPGGAAATGRLIVGHDVTDLGNGRWRYEYAVYNMNSDRGVRAFSVPLPSGVTLTNVGFSAPAHHSFDGEGTSAATPVNVSTAPWSFSSGGGHATWSTGEYATDPNANAIRWGTLYNFRFDADAPPATYAGSRQGVLGMFKPSSPPGAPAETAVPVRAPGCLLTGDVNGDGVVDFQDLSLVIAGFGSSFGMADLMHVLAGYGARCFG